jgi:ketosteroid isomerase-like protein
MWDENPALAYDLMTDDCVQWSAQLSGLDAVVGPDQQERFVTAYRARQINLFRPRLLVDGGDQFAYLWDATSRDGTVRTGADVNVLRDARIEANWTSVAQWRADAPDFDVTTDDPTDAAHIEQLCHSWTQLWDNPSAELADLLTDDVTVFFGTRDATATDLRGPSALVDHIERLRATDPSFTVSAHRRPVIDAARGRAALLRTTTCRTPDGAVSVGGIDVLTIRDGRIAQAWSLPGVRPFRY